MKTMIVPLDGSVLAEQALPYATRVALALKARVRLLQVVLPAARAVAASSPGEAEGEEGPPRWELGVAWEALRAHAQSYLDTHAEPMRAAGLAVDVEVQFGRPAETIVEVASERHAAMIVMATHGYSGLRRWALGSVADQVVHTTHVPVLLVRRVPLPDARAVHPLAEECPLKRVLVPLDGTALSRQALAPALDVAIGAEAEVIALQTVAAPMERQVGALAPVADLSAELRNEVAQAYALRAGSVAPEWAPITPIVTLGDAAKAIVEEAGRQHVDMIVMVTHAYSGLRRWLSDSVADRVMHATTVPLLLVRAQVNAG